MLCGLMSACRGSSGGVVTVQQPTLLSVKIENGQIKMLLLFSIRVAE